MEFILPPDPRFVPIPSEFHSLEKDGPFEVCLRCECRLYDSGRPYLIERVFRLNEPIIEYAMCEACVLESQSELSEESRAAITQYVLNSFDFRGRVERLRDWISRDGHDVSELTGICAVSGDRAEGCRERQIAAWCQGNQMRVDHVFPMMISGKAIKELNGLLSEKTRGWIDDFVGDSFGMPPEFCDNPDFRPVLI